MNDTPNAIERLALESDIIARGDVCPSCGAEWNETAMVLDHLDTCRHIALQDLVRVVHEMRHFERELEETNSEDDLIELASAIHAKFGEWRSVLNHVNYVR